VALTGPSAAAAHGLVLHDLDLSKVHVVRLDRGSPRREAGIVHHTVGDDLAEQIACRDELPVVDVARTSRWIWKNVMPQGEVAFLRRLRRELDQSRRLYVPRFALA
jgi:hypothetical protein